MIAADGFRFNGDAIHGRKSTSVSKYNPKSFSTPNHMSALVLDAKAFSYLLHHTFTRRIFFPPRSLKTIRSLEALPLTLALAF